MCVCVCVCVCVCIYAVIKYVMWNVELVLGQMIEINLGLLNVQCIP